MAAQNLVDKGVPRLLDINIGENQEIKKFTKIKKPKWNFKNIITVPKRKAWDWNEQEGMFGKGIFDE